MSPTAVQLPSGGRPCGCWAHGDSRTCYELRTYGYSPIAREENEWTREWGVRVDEDGDCECVCHGVDDDEEVDAALLARPSTPSASDLPLGPTPTV